MDNHEKQFLMDAERKYTIKKAMRRVNNLLSQKSTKNDLGKIYGAVEDIDIAASLAKSKLKKFRKKLTI